MTQIMKNRFLKYQGQNAMRKSFFLAALAMLFFVGGSVQAQIYVEFESPVKKGNRPYTPLQTGATVYTANNFTVPPNIDPDDGFAAAQLPFPFEYNGTVYNWILINVNGFVMMNPDGNVPLGVVGQNVTLSLRTGVTTSSVLVDRLSPVTCRHKY
jgi:hypothetical protein